MQSRGGKGIINLKTTESKGRVVAVIRVAEDSEVMIITQQGKVIRIESSEIRSAGRSTQGVRLLRLEEGDRITVIGDPAGIHRLYAMYRDSLPATTDG